MIQNRNFRNITSRTTFKLITISWYYHNLISQKKMYNQKLKFSIIENSS